MGENEISFNNLGGKSKETPPGRIWVACDLAQKHVRKIPLIFPFLQSSQRRS